MKKLIMMFSLLLSVVLCSQQAQAFKLLGVEISYKRGYRDWDSTHTKTMCVQKGLCEFTIKGGMDAGAIMANGTFGYDENGHLGLSFSTDILRNPDWKETFVNGIVTVTQDILIDRDIINKLPNCPTVIKPGRYKYIVEGNQACLFFN